MLKQLLINYIIHDITVKVNTTIYKNTNEIKIDILPANKFGGFWSANEISQRKPDLRCLPQELMSQLSIY